MSETRFCRVCRQPFTRKGRQLDCSRACNDRWHARRRYGNAVPVDERSMCRSCGTDLQGAAEASLGECTCCWVPPAAKHLSWSLVDKLYGGGTNRGWGHVGSR